MSLGGGGGRNSRGTGPQAGDVEVEVTVIPTIRSREVRFRAKGLLPNTRHFPFFDGVRVDAYCYPQTFVDGDGWRWSNRDQWEISDRVSTNEEVRFNDGSYRNTIQNTWLDLWAPNNADDPGDPAATDFPGALVSDAYGSIDGVFHIPNNDQLSFPVGSRIFSLYDVTSENDAGAASRARAEYFAEGIHRRITEFVAPPPPPDNDDNDNDPIAQTFTVDNDEGVFITKVGVYFQSKDGGNLPVELQIRPVINGYPASREYLPGSSVFLNPADVSVSDDASSVTYFEFPAPIQLNSGVEYAVVLITQSFDYNVWISRMGDFPVGETDRKITSQPSLGSLFKSQNGRTWEPSQYEDLKFTLHRAVFATSGTAIIENNEPTERLLPGSPFLFDSGDATVRVIHPNHGMFVNDTVRLWFDSSETLPVEVASLWGDRTITAVDATGYTFEADSNASSGGRFGGTSVKAPDQILMDYMIPSIDVYNTVLTSTTFSGKFTTGKSLAGTETPYSKDTSFGSNFKTHERTFFNAPRLIANYANETNELSGAKSVTIQAAMSTTSDYVSPVIDADRMSITAINNVIDNQDSAATSGYNVPLTWVSETDATLGSAVAKYVTKPVTLEEDAVGIKIILAANRPSESNFKVYYKAITESENLEDTAWVLVEPEAAQPADVSPLTSHEYRYLVGGDGGTMTPYTTFQVKIVMNSTNSSKIPTFRDLRIIALTV